MDKKIETKVLQSRRRRKFAKIGLAIVVATGVLFGVLMMLEKSIDSRSVILGTVDVGDIETTVSATGSVVPAYEEIINSPITTSLLGVYAVAGDSVKAGTPLLELDLESEQSNYDKMVDSKRVSEQELAQLQLQSQSAISELSMQIAVKEMEVSGKEIDVINERRLDSLGSGTGDRVRLAETALQTARLELSRLREQLENERLRCIAAEKVRQLQVSSIDKDLTIMQTTLNRGKITAPHDGILTFIVNEIGSQISAGQKVAVVSNLSSFKIIGDIAEGSSDRMAIGARVLIRIGKVELEGMVTNITPQSKSGIVQFIVNPDDPRNPRLRSGARVELYISYGFRDSVVRLPMGQYYKGAGTYDLYVEESPNHLVRKKVRLGEGNRKYVEVISGLNPGDKVAIGDMSQYEKYSSLKIK